MTTFITRILLLAFVALLSACGGGGGGEESSTPAAPTARLRYITITPANKIIAVGDSLVLTATGTYEDGTSAVLTTGLTWTSSGTSSFSGTTVTGKRIGTETITVTSGLISSTTKLTIKGAVTAVAAGGQHALAQKADGSLVAWGFNLSGQLGDGTGKDSPVSVPVFQTATGTTWASFTAGELFSLGITTKGSMWGWGYNRNGQLGNKNNVSQKSPVQVGNATTWAAVDAGKAHSVGLLKDGTLWTWGRNVDGQLGDGTTVDKSEPTAIGTLKTWVEVSAGESHTLARQSNGSLWTWGSNASGQLGSGAVSDTDITAPTALPGTVSWVAINAGDLHSLAIRSDGALFAWGANAAGQVGSGSAFDTIASPTQILVDPDATAKANFNWDKVSGGGFHTLAVLTDGSLWAWGLNDDGQLGNDSNQDARVPQRIGLDNDWVAIAAGQYASYALKSDGTLWAWGRNTSGELGIGSKTNVNRPTLVVAP